MATVTEYRPRSVLLPADSPVLRQFYSWRSHRPDVDTLDARDYEGFDQRTILYDMALDREGRKLLGFAPPMVNLGRALLPVIIKARRPGDHDWVRLRVRRRRRSRWERWEMSLPRNWGPMDALEFCVRFGNGQEFAAQAERVPLSQAFQQWSTLQKDNPLEWIDDWVRYAASQGASRVLLYDNGSKNYGELADQCRTIQADIEVVVIPWPFPYGPPRSHYNYFTQRAQMNHAHHIMGACTWQGFMDLDEYPVAPGGLQRLLKSQPGWRGLLRMNSFMVPAIEGELQPSRLPRAWDFAHRSRKPRGKGHKCFARTSALSEMKTHSGRVRLGYVSGSISVERLYFLHYESLTNGWKDPSRGMVASPFNPAMHAQESAVRSAFMDRALTKSTSAAETM
jgi:hypothetical protein